MLLAAPLSEVIVLYPDRRAADRLLLSGTQGDTGRFCTITDVRPFVYPSGALQDGPGERQIWRGCTFSQHCRKRQLRVHQFCASYLIFHTCGVHRLPCGHPLGVPLWGRRPAFWWETQIMKQILENHIAAMMMMLSSLTGVVFFYFPLLPAFNVLVNFGIAITYPTLISLGIVLSVPVNASECLSCCITL